MKLKTFLLISFLFFAVCGKPSYHHPKNSRVTHHHKVVSKKKCEILKKKPLKLTYHSIYKDAHMENLCMIGEVGRYGVDGDMGKILRILRYKNIADAVESRYTWIPRGTILAMIAQEDGGADLLPNGNDDGGVGIIHMQGETAHMFGLKTFGNCTDMVCKTHGRELRKLIENNNGDKKRLVKFDDRFNSVLNLDAVGRMLTYYKCGATLKGFTPVQTAICRYSGSYNYNKYYGGVQKYRKLLKNKSYLKKVESTFNGLNSSFKIDGKKANFKKYITACQKQNYNYGLEKYKGLGGFK